MPDRTAGHCKLCEVEDFAEPVLRGLIRDVYRPGAGPLAPPEGDERQAFPEGREERKHWEVAMTLRALAALGALRRDAEVLAVGAGREATIYWLTNRVRRVFATDLYLTEDSWSAGASAPEMLTDPGRFWRGPWNPRRLVVQHMDALEQSQSLTTELQSRQRELQQTNAELAEKAALLAEQNERIEVKNREIEMARLALEEKAEQLALSSRYKSEFLANMSHELRTPLNSLLILAKLLGDNGEGNLTDRQVEFADTIFTAGTDLLDLIDDILDLSKVEAGKMDVHRGEVALAGVAEEVERAFRPLVEEKGLRFELELDPGLSPQIVTDQQRLQQILRNLLSNAVKFTERGAVTLRVSPAPAGTAFRRADLGSAGEVVAFAVSDTGIGIARDRLELIFEAFHQADGTTSRPFGGTGLGLSISREIARLLGGEIAVESVVDAGSTFTLFLPAAGAAADLPELAPAPVELDDPIVRPEVPDDRGALEPGDRVLLVVEDDASFAATLVRLGRDAGFKCVAALRGDTGLALAHEHRPDAIILDLRLPVIDGWTVLARLKRHPATRDIPVHVLSGDEAAGGALDAGAAGSLAKPISAERLTGALAEIARAAEPGARRLLVLEDAGRRTSALLGEVAAGDVRIRSAGSPDEALAALEEGVDGAVVELAAVGGAAALEVLLDRLDGPVVVVARVAPEDGERAALAGRPGVTLLEAGEGAELLAGTRAFLRDLHAVPAARTGGVGAPAPADPAVFAGRRALIVDDDVRNVFALASALEANGMEVAYAENGAEGIELLRSGEPADIVLLDVMMPGMDGYQTTAAIRAIPEFASLPIIAVTAKAMAGDRERAIASGASGYITKPVDVDRLLSLMAVWLYPAGAAEPPTA